MAEPPEEVCGDLYYNIYRGDSCQNSELLSAIVSEIKDFIFESVPFTLAPRGYSGVPLFGKTPINSRPDDVWKIIEILFKLSDRFPGLIFSISTDDPCRNPLYVEAERNEVIPKGLAGASDFNNKVYGCGGVMHVVSDAVKSAHPNTLNVDIVRLFGRETRNILLTEAVKQRVHEGSARSFGMHRIAVNLPEQIAYIARQRPDILSCAIQEMASAKVGKHEDAELILEASTRVMVHVNVNTRDWATLNQVADIDAPVDIISHRAAVALIDFDRKYSNCQNGDACEHDFGFGHVDDEFERERLNCLAAQLKGERFSMAHLYQSSKTLLTERHLQLCYNLFQDFLEGAESIDDAGVSDNSILEQPVSAKRQVRKKKAPSNLGKKRTLAAVNPRLSNKPTPPPISDDEYERNPASEHFKSFERALNGYDAYKASSSERSLGEEEEMSMFASRSKNKESKTKKRHHKRATVQSFGAIGFPAAPAVPSSGAQRVAVADEDAFDVSELLDAAPPLATNDEFDDI